MPIADFKKFVDGLLKPVTTKVGAVDARIKALLPSASDGEYWAVDETRKFLYCREVGFGLYNK